MSSSAPTESTPPYGSSSILMKESHASHGKSSGARQVEAEPFLDGQTMVIAGHFHQRTIVYPSSIAAGSKLLTNWICQMTVLDQAPPREDWNKRVERQTVLAAFGRWRFPWLDLPTLIEELDSIFEFPLVDRIAAWSFDRVTLLGDAAHPSNRSVARLVRSPSWTLGHSPAP